MHIETIYTHTKDEFFGNIAQFLFLLPRLLKNFPSINEPPLPANDFDFSETG